MIQDLKCIILSFNDYLPGVYGGVCLLLSSFLSSVYPKGGDFLYDKKGFYGGFPINSISLLYAPGPTSPEA
jgi:hypothetical protein